MKPFQNLMQGNRNGTSRFQRKPGKYSISNPVLYVDPQDRNMDHGSDEQHVVLTSEEVTGLMSRPDERTLTIRL
jgi:hypothetical protein